MDACEDLKASIQAREADRRLLALPVFKGDKPARRLSSGAGYRTLRSPLLSSGSSTLTGSSTLNKMCTPKCARLVVALRWAPHFLFLFTCLCCILTTTLRWVIFC